MFSPDDLKYKLELCYTPSEHLNFWCFQYCNMRTLFQTGFVEEISFETKNTPWSKCSVLYLVRQITCDTVLSVKDFFIIPAYGKRSYTICVHIATIVVHPPYINSVKNILSHGSPMSYCVGLGFLPSYCEVNRLYLFIKHPLWTGNGREH